MAAENDLPATIKHISDTMAFPPTAPKPHHALPELPQSSTAVPLPLVPGPSPPQTPRLPTSEFSTYRPRPPWKPTCSHIIMTRLYSRGATCDTCKQQPEQGWLYRCVQDREALLRQQMEDGRKVTFDDIGAMLVEEVKPAHRGPEERSDKYSFLTKEITAEDMKQYSPEQIAIILQQREHANDVAQVQLRESRLRYSKIPVTKISEILGRDAGRKPWSPKESEECRFKVCHTCRPMMEDRSYLSIDGIVDGDIPAHAAVGWGFAYFRARPICNPNVIRNWGNRPIPLTRRGIPRASSMPLSLASSSHWSVMDIIDEHLKDSSNFGEEESEEELEDLLFVSKHRDQQTMKRHSRHLPTPIRIAENGTVGLHTTENELDAQELLIRPPWTPPPSPSLSALGGGVSLGLSTVGLASEVLICDGRSDASLKTNPHVRSEVFSSLLPSSIRSWVTSPNEFHSDLTTARKSSHHMLYEPEEAYDVGLTLPFNQEVYDIACATPLPESDNKEDLYFLEEKTAMEEFEEDEGVFTAAPLDVPHGVAVTEEAVGLGVADVVTKV